MTYVIIVDQSMKYKVKKISSQLSYSIMKEIAKEKKIKNKNEIQTRASETVLVGRYFQLIYEAQMELSLK